MTYPYIGKCKENNLTVLFTSFRSGTTLHCDSSDITEKHKYETGFNEREFKNITADYLRNTYGKLESKEHAEFIVKLAEGAGFKVGLNYEGGKSYFNFYDETIVDFWNDEVTSSANGEKLITIPLPPKEILMPDFNVDTPVQKTKTPKEENMSNLDLIPSNLNSEHENWGDYYVSKGSWLWQRLEQLNSRTGCMSYDTPEKGIIRDIWNQLNTDIKTNKENTNLQKTGFKVGELVVWDGNKKVYGRIKSISGGIATITAYQILDKAEYKKDLCSLKRYAATAENQPKGSKEWPVVGDSFIHKGELVKCISKGIMSNGDEVITFEFSDGLSHGSCWNNESWVKKTTNARRGACK